MCIKYSAMLYEMGCCEKVNFTLVSDIQMKCYVKNKIKY